MRRSLPIPQHLHPNQRSTTESIIITADHPKPDAIAFSHHFLEPEELSQSWTLYGAGEELNRQELLVWQELTSSNHQRGLNELQRECAEERQRQEQARSLLISSTPNPIELAPSTLPTTPQRTTSSVTRQRQRQASRTSRSHPHITPATTQATALATSALPRGMEGAIGESQPPRRILEIPKSR